MPQNPLARASSWYSHTSVLGTGLIPNQSSGDRNLGGVPQRKRADHAWSALIQLSRLKIRLTAFSHQHDRGD